MDECTRLFPSILASDVHFMNICNPTIVIIIVNNKEAGIQSSSVRRFVEQAPIIGEQSQREKRYRTRNMQAIRTNL